MFGGKLSAGCGRVLDIRPGMVSSSWVVPEAGSSSRKSVAVTIRARPSIPNATPSGAAPSVNVRFVELLRSTTVIALADEAGGATFP